jgi:hypothetical protein
MGVVLGAFLLERLARGGQGIRLIVAMAAGVAGLVQGLTLSPVFWHGLVLVSIPGWVERTAVALALGGGAAALVFTFADTKGESEGAPALDPVSEMDP